MEFWATCKVFQELFPGAEGETVRLESEAVSDVSKGTKATSKIAEVEDGINAVEKAGVEVGKISEGGSATDFPPSNAVAPKPSWVDTVKTYIGNSKMPKKPK